MFPFICLLLLLGKKYSRNKTIVYARVNHILYLRTYVRTCTRKLECVQVSKVGNEIVHKILVAAPTMQ